ncbi:MAG: hypothetical protein JO002_14480 [Burkholderiaceae bacterium]|nr:hypothetical protein [Burkholderiaceae bacterium]
MVYLGKLVGTLVLALGIAALGAVASTDAYSIGARTEASSYKAINRLMGSPSSMLCMNSQMTNEQGQVVQE